MREHRLEVALRLKTDKGVLLAEHVIRGDRVEMINYFPNGQISRAGECGIDEFLEAVKKLAQEKR